MYDSLLAKSKAVSKGIANIVDTIQGGVSSDALIERLNELEEQKRQIQETIELEELKMALDDNEHTISSYFARYANADVDDPTTRDILLNYFIDKIYVYDGYLRIFTWYFTGNKEIEFWEENGMPYWVWRENDLPVKSKEDGSSMASHLAPP